MSPPESLEAAAFLGAVLDRLIQSFGADEHAEALRQAREEFDERRGRVFEEEDLWESWSQSFLEWYLLERPLAVDRVPPAARALPLAGTPRQAAALRAWLSSHRALAEVTALGGGRVDLADLIGGARFSVTEKRILHGVAAGDVVEVRLIGFEGEVYFGRSFCFHPRGTRDALVAFVRRKRGEGAGRVDILDACARLRIRCERYTHVTPLKIYQAARADTEIQS